MTRKKKVKRSKGNPEFSFSRTNMRKTGSFRKPSKATLVEKARSKDLAW